MKRRLLAVIFLALLVLSSNSCATSPDIKRDEYDLLCSAVSASSYAVIGEYGDSIPADFKVDKFIEVVETNIPKDYLKVLKPEKFDVNNLGLYDKCSPR